MRTWEQLRKRIAAIEVMVLAIALLALLFGMICDVLVENGVVFVVVENLENISLVLLQIQAAVTTLTLTVIAFLSGVISDSYMGVSISSYYLEIRPYILKQKIVIIAEFACLAVNIWGHIFSKYNLVIALCMVALLLVIVSIMEIYSVFYGRRKSLFEIELYITYLIDRGKKYKTIGDSFLEDWKNIVAEQSTEEFGLYFGLFMKYVERGLSDEADVKTANSMCEDVARFLLENESKTCRVKGIKFVNEYYDKLWLWIYANQDKVKDLNDSFHLIDRVDHEWYLAIDSLDAETVENILGWEHFSEVVIRVSSWVGYSKDKNSGEPSTINGIARTFGGYIDKQYKKGNIVNSKRWEKIIAHRFEYGAYGIPEEAAEFYRESLILRDFNVCCGFLLSGQAILVKNAIFLDGLGNIYIIDHSAVVQKYMVIHCFMYYLAFRESTECIDEALQNEIRAIITDEEVVKTVSHFYYRIVEGKNLLSKHIEEQLETILERYELFPKHSRGKTMISERVAREYFLYAALLTERHSYYKETLAQLLDIDRYSSYLYDPDHQILIRRFSEMGQLFECGKDNEEDNKRRVDYMLAVFDSVLKVKYKENIIQTAAESQKKYEDSEIQIDISTKIRQVINEKFSALFSGMDTACKGQKKYKKIHVYRCTDFTRWLGEDISYAYSDYPFENFIIWLIRELEKSFGVKVIDRDSVFQTDKDFREFLDKNKYKILFGSQYVFGCEDYEEYEIHSDFLNERTCSFIPTSYVGVAAMDDSLSLRLDDVVVDINSPNLDDMNINKDKETGLIAYSPVSGISIDFAEDELQKFIHDERKVVDIYFSVTIGVKKKTKEDVCSIIVRKQ